MNATTALQTRDNNTTGTMAQIMHRCYDGSVNPEKFAAGVIRQHPSLQQAFFRCMMAVVKAMARDDYQTDARNHAAHEIARRIVKSGAIDDCYLAYL